MSPVNLEVQLMFQIRLDSPDHALDLNDSNLDLAIALTLATW
jgi:hypothetical protein